MPGAERRRDETILVTNCGRGSAIAFLRSLARAGWRVIAAAADPRAAGFRSRHVAGRLVYPDPTARPQEFVTTLREGAQRLGVDLIVPITDETLLPLSEARHGFEGVCRLAVPEAEALDVVSDKRKTLELAELLGVPAPRTCLVRTREQARAEAQRCQFPIVLKPQRSRLYRGDGSIEAFEVRYAESPDALDRQMQRFEGRCGVLLQEYLDGVGHGVEILADRGRPLAAFQHRRLHELPIQGGRSALRESVPLDPELYEFSTRLLSALDWTGLAMVEFRVGTRGPMLMEINGRVWGSLPLAVHSGMDFPRRLAELCLDGPPDPEAPVARGYRIGVRAQSLELEIKWILSMLAGPRVPFLQAPPRREALRGLLGLLDPRIRFDIQSLDDPRPGFADAGRLLRNLVARLGRAPAAARLASRGEPA